MKLGLIGCGRIGSGIIKHIKDMPNIEITGFHDRHAERMERLLELVPRTRAMSFDELVSSAEFVIEAASAEAAVKLIKIAKNKTLLVMSTIGLCQIENLQQLIVTNRLHILVPSGAIAGLDGLKAAAQSKIDSVEIITRKPPQSFLNAPYIKDKEKLLSEDKEIVLFEGSAAAAVEGFPENVNVAATLSLAGIGLKNTKVKLIADPNATSITHQISIKTNDSNISIICQNLYDHTRPQTSTIAIYSAVSKIKEYLTGSSLSIGT